MRLATKIAFGFAVLVILMLAAQVYQASLIRYMGGLHERFASIDFHLSRTALRLRQDLEQLEEFAEKYVLLREPDYGRQLKPFREQLGTEITALAGLSLKGTRKEEVARLNSLWNEFSLVFSNIERAYAQNDPEAAQRWLTEAAPLFARLQVETSHLIEHSVESVQDEVELSQAMSRRAQWVSWGAVGLGLVLAVLVSYLVIRAITRPLQQLTHGTRKIAQGSFTYLVDDRSRDELGELARHFNVMVHRLEELETLKRDFVSHTSHELKAPLASIIETTRLLLDELPGPLTEKQKRLLEMTRRSSLRLSDMIANLLDLSIIEAGAMQYDFEVSNLSPILRRVIEDYSGLYVDKGLTVTNSLPDHPILVNCDEDRMIQVFGNLITNAVNFSPESGSIRVELRETQKIPEDVPEWALADVKKNHRAGYARASVTDQGPGVPDRHKQGIFEKFYEIRAGKKISGQGTGLGLTISLNIVQAHQGAIWAADNPEGGSVFSVLLPVKESLDA